MLKISNEKGEVLRRDSDSGWKGGPESPVTETPALPSTPGSF